MDYVRSLLDLREGEIHRSLPSRRDQPVEAKAHAVASTGRSAAKDLSPFVGGHELALLNGGQPALDQRVDALSTSNLGGGQGCGDRAAETPPCLQPLDERQ